MGWVSVQWLLNLADVKKRKEDEQWRIELNWQRGRMEGIRSGWDEEGRSMMEEEGEWYLCTRMDWVSTGLWVGMGTRWVVTLSRGDLFSFLLSFPREKVSSVTSSSSSSPSSSPFFFPYHTFNHFLSLTDWWTLRFHDWSTNWWVSPFHLISNSVRVDERVGRKERVQRRQHIHLSMDGGDGKFTYSFRSISTTRTSSLERVGEEERTRERENPLLFSHSLPFVWYAIPVSFPSSSSSFSSSLSSSFLRFQSFPIRSSIRWL